MKHEYINGVRVTPLVHELTPLEAAIERYAEQANMFYCATNVLNKSLTKLEREQRLMEAQNTLARERRLAEVTAVVQTRLEEYRAAGNAHRSKKGLSVLLSEKHHPTKLLMRFMRAVGKVRPSAKHTAHHIVPGKGKTDRSALVRIHIHTYGIRINDPDNGVWMVRLKKDVPHWSMPNSKNHLAIHTYNYERWIQERLVNVYSEKELRQKLNLLGRMLQDGKQPAYVTMPPNEG